MFHFTSFPPKTTKGMDPDCFNSIKWVNLIETFLRNGTSLILCRYLFYHFVTFKVKCLYRVFQKNVVDFKRAIPSKMCENA